MLPDLRAATLNCVAAPDYVQVWKSGDSEVLYSAPPKGWVSVDVFVETWWVDLAGRRAFIESVLGNGINVNGWGSVKWGHAVGDAKFAAMAAGNSYGLWEVYTPREWWLPLRLRSWIANHGGVITYGQVQTRPLLTHKQVEVNND